VGKNLKYRNFEKYGHKTTTSAKQTNNITIWKHRSQSIYHIIKFSN